MRTERRGTEKSRLFAIFAKDSANYAVKVLLS